MKKKKGTESMVRIESLEDLIQGTLRTLEGVMNDTIDNRKASVIFAGARTATGELKMGLEAMRLGLKDVGGVKMGSFKKIEE